MIKKSLSQLLDEYYGAYDKMPDPSIMIHTTVIRKNEPTLRDFDNLLNN